MNGYAVSYDGSKTSNNVVFYKGTRTTTVAALSTNSLNRGPFNPGYSQFAIGNTYSDASNPQPFDGWLDNFRMFGGAGSGGVLTAGEIAAIQAEDVAGAVPAIRFDPVLEMTPSRLPQPASLTFRWWSIGGRHFQLQHSDDLDMWRDVSGAGQPGDGSQQEYRLNNPAAMKDFFRLEVTPSP